MWEHLTIHFSLQTKTPSIVGIIGKYCTWIVSFILAPLRSSIQDAKETRAVGQKVCFFLFIGVVVKMRAPMLTVPSSMP